MEHRHDGRRPDPRAEEHQRSLPWPQRERASRCADVQAIANGFDWTPPFKPVLKAMGVDASMIMDFHGDGHPNDLTDVRLSPLLSPSLAGLPPALIITAEYDPLRDEGEEYAARLRDAGVPTQLSRYEGTIHGFFTMPGILRVAREAMADTAAFLRSHW